MENKIDKKDLQNLEEKAIIKYEKKAKPYRGLKYKRFGKQIVCQKCGSSYNLTKTVVDGIDYWFCKNCIIERANQIRQRGL